MVTAKRLAYTLGQGLPGGIGGLLDLYQGAVHFSYLYDGKGNVTGLLDPNGNVAATYQYDPFGVPRIPANSVQQPFQFSTKPYDEKTGLSYYGYRYYVPTLGRWLTRDPIGEAGGINLYGFVGNSPVNQIDPWGLFVMPPQRPRPGDNALDPGPINPRDICNEWPFGKPGPRLPGDPPQLPFFPPFIFPPSVPQPDIPRDPYLENPLYPYPNYDPGFLPYILPPGR